MKRFHSLRAKMPVFMVLILAVPLILFALFGYTQARTYFVHEKLGDMMNIIDTKYIHILDLLDRGKSEVSAFAKNPTVVGEAKQYADGGDMAVFGFTAQYLRDTVESNRIKGKHALDKDVPTKNRYEEILVVDNDGRVLASSREAGVGQILKKTDYPKDAPGAIDAHIDDQGRAVFGFSAPIEIETAPGKSEKVGNIVAKIDVALLEMIMTGEIGNVTGGELYFAGYSDSLDFYVMNKDGLMITQSRALDEDTVLKVEGSSEPIKRALDVNAQGTRTTNAGLVTGAREVMETYTDFQGKEVAAASMVIFDMLWTVVIEEDVQEAFAPIYGLSAMLGIALVVTIFGGAVFGVIFSSRITTPLLKVAESANRIAGGNLGEKVKVDRADEIGTLASAFNQMAAKVREMVGSEQAAKEYLQSTVGKYTRFVDAVSAGNLGVRLDLNGQQDDLSVLGHNLNDMVFSLDTLVKKVQGASADMASASSEISAAAVQQNAGANQQVSSINQTTATVDEVRQTAAEANDRAQSVADAAQTSVSISEEGLVAVEQTISGMKDIKDRVEQIAGNILALSEQTQQIGNIISTVNDISEQSNLLALNASIEAARAGDHGKGFAVVAAEVRNLAEQSQQATAQVKSILDDIQRATDTVVIVTEEGTKGVDSGMQLADKAGKTIQSLAEAIHDAAGSAEQIVASAKQQSVGMDQIADAMNDIGKSAAQALAANSQTEETAENLSSLGSRLRETVAAYGVEAGEKEPKKLSRA